MAGGSSKWRAWLTAFLYNCAFSLACDNHVAEKIDLLGRLIEGIQLTALALHPALTGWGQSGVQLFLSYFLLEFGSSTEFYALVIVVLFMFLMFARLGIQVASYGIAPVSRFLHFGRISFKVVQTILCLPVAVVVARVLDDNAIILLSAADSSNTGDAGGGAPGNSNSTATAIANIVLAVVVFGIALLPTMVTLTFLSPPDHARITGLTRISSRQQLWVGLLKLALGASYSLLGAQARYTTISGLLALLASIFIVPYYGAGLPNLLSTMWVALPTFFAIVALFLPGTGTTATSSPFFMTAIIGAIPFAAAMGALYVLRLQYLLRGTGFWERELRNLGHYWKSVGAHTSRWRASAVRRASQAVGGTAGGEAPATPATPSAAGNAGHGDAATTAAAEAVFPALPPDVVLSRCRFHLEVVTAAYYIHFASHGKAMPWVVDFTTRATKKFAGNVMLQELLILWLGYFDAGSAHQRAVVNNMIRKLVARHMVFWDVRFTFFRILKMHEMATYRQQEDLRRFTNLDLARYIHNFTLARKEHTVALRWACHFWKSASSDHPNIDTIDFLAGRMQKHQTRSLRHYRILLYSFPSVISLLRCYASFVLDCLNNRSLAEEILEHAEKLQEDRMESRSAVPYHHAATVAALRPAPSSVAVDNPSTVSLPMMASGPSPGDSARQMMPPPASPNKSASGNIRARRSNNGSTDLLQTPGATGGGDDTYSEHTRTSSHAHSSDVLQSINAQSIFDVDSFEEQRHGLAMAGLRKLAQRIVLSLGVLLAGIIALYLIGVNVMASEAADRASMLDAGDLRISFLQASYDILTLNHQLATNATVADMTRTQQSLILSGANVMITLNAMFNRSSTIGTNLNFWATPFAYDFNTGTTVNPMAFIRQFGLSLYSSGLYPAAYLDATYGDLVWLTTNVLPPTDPDAFLAGSTAFVKAFQQFYETNVAARGRLMHVTGIVLSCLPVVVFLVLFLPIWIKLSREITGVMRLYGRIPRRVAQVLAQEMSECLKEQMESDGVDSADMPAGAGSGGGGGGGGGKDGGGAAGSREQLARRSTAADADSTKGAGALSSGSTSTGSTGGTGDDWSGLNSGQDRLARNHQLMARSLWLVVAMLVLISAVTVGLLMSFVIAIDYSSERASIINYSGGRMSYMFRALTYARELTYMNGTTANATLLRGLMVRHAETARQIHEGVLFGNRSMNIGRTFGYVVPADSITFTRSCNGGLECISIEEGFAFFTLTARRIYDTGTVTPGSLGVLTAIASNGTNFRNNIMAVRNVYSMLHAPEIAMANTASTGLFACIFPLYVVMGVALYYPLSSVANFIRRTRYAPFSEFVFVMIVVGHTYAWTPVRNILFQLPEETVVKIPPVRDYLRTGAIDLSHISVFSRKRRAAKKPTTSGTPASAAAAETTGKRRRSQVAADANARLRLSIGAAASNEPPITIDAATPTTAVNPRAPVTLQAPGDGDKGGGKGDPPPLSAMRRHTVPDSQRVVRIVDDRPFEVGATADDSTPLPRARNSLDRAVSTSATASALVAPSHPPTASMFSSTESNTASSSASPSPRRAITRWIRQQQEQLEEERRRAASAAAAAVDGEPGERPRAISGQSIRRLLSLGNSGNAGGHGSAAPPPPQPSRGAGAGGGEDANGVPSIRAIPPSTGTLPKVESGPDAPSPV
ncbi:hypothetical protein AMAG_00179 [Allomyces macrogynus ATCC 38327]|uniref:TmcB/TmcC TPR repeats domain-containing protein n=1 Tax=Allomyces macrogynus (strain ATCC 38327) TaxID=578462 RepID=A0A0L0RVS2_ALLM3|nr:hypothetical protein AMAG_00179 [Allomyces macrogynus ATCC 38327]|eukprot:KNE54185.1 hypothetical protein AMAG_00179 [Allomyces macrogynus ATCC 38327]